MKNLTTILLITICSITAFSQASPFKHKEERTTHGEYNEIDQHTFDYKNMDVSITYKTMYVYDNPEYASSSIINSLGQHHQYLQSTDGTIIQTYGGRYEINLGDITLGDTLIVIKFRCDSITGFASFRREYYIGAKRNELVGVASILEKQELEVFPNPVVDILNLKNIEGTFSYMVYDMMGRAILGGNSTGRSLDVGFLQKGQYILTIKSGDKEYASKINKL